MAEWFGSDFVLLIRKGWLSHPDFGFSVTRMMTIQEGICQPIG
jgi:hypothetical protein